MLEFEPPRSLIQYFDQAFIEFDKPKTVPPELESLTTELHERSLNIIDGQWFPYRNAWGNYLAGWKRSKMSRPLIIEGRTVSFHIIQQAPKDEEEGAFLDKATTSVNAFIEAEWGKEIGIYHFTAEAIYRASKPLVTREEYSEAQEALDFIKNLL